MSLTRGIPSDRIISRKIETLIDTVRGAVPEKKDSDGNPVQGELVVTSFTVMDGSRTVRIHDTLTGHNVDYQIGTRGITLLNPERLDDYVDRLGAVAHNVDEALYALGYPYNPQTKMYQ